jgi:hypothetical protein
MGSATDYSSIRLDDPRIAAARANISRFAENSGTDQFYAVDTPPPPPDLTDEAVKQAKQAALFQGMAMTGYQSTFISGMS